MKKYKVFYCFDNNYFDHFLVSIASVINHNNSINFEFHILTPGMSGANLKLLEKFKIKFGVEIVEHLHRFDKQAFKEVGHLKRATYLRIYLPDISPSETIIYLDADTIAIGSFDEDFFRIVDATAYIAAAEEQGDTGEHLGLDKYSNAGVMVMNNKNLNDINFKRKCLDVLESKWEVIKWADQCVINLVLDCKIRSLPLIYNFQKQLFINSEVEKLSQDGVKIIHFTSSDKPWQLHKKIWGQSLYWRYRLLLPGGLNFFLARAMRALALIILPNRVISMLVNKN